jgi:hypothetical protein
LACSIDEVLPALFGFALKVSHPLYQIPGLLGPTTIMPMQRVPVVNVFRSTRSGMRVGDDLGSWELEKASIDFFFFFFFFF